MLAFPLGSVIGLVGGVVQDCISFFKDKADKKMQNAHELELEKLRSENRIKEAHANVQIEQEKTKQIQNQLDSQLENNQFSIKAEEIKSENNWHNNVTKSLEYLPGNDFLSHLANLFIATARPMITYLVGALVLYIAIHPERYIKIENATWYHEFIIGIGYIFETATSYWFYNRGSQKFKEGLNLKKK